MASNAEHQAAYRARRTATPEQAAEYRKQQAAYQRKHRAKARRDLMRSRTKRRSASQWEAQYWTDLDGWYKVEREMREKIAELESEGTAEAIELKRRLADSRKLAADQHETIKNQQDTIDRLIRKLKGKSGTDAEELSNLLTQVRKHPNRVNQFLMIAAKRAKNEAADQAIYQAARHVMGDAETGG